MTASMAEAVFQFKLNVNQSFLIMKMINDFKLPGSNNG